MKAVYIERYGGRDQLRYGELPEPEPGEGEVLVEVRAAGVKPVDWKIREGRLRSRIAHAFPLVLGWDVAGVVARTGPGVTRFRPGDEVMARPAIERNGTYAEYVAVAERLLAPKPRNLAFEEAASLPLAGLTAWEALVEIARLQPGQRVLVHGGAGGVGSLAVQLAKAFGARVATTTSGRARGRAGRAHGLLLPRARRREAGQAGPPGGRGQAPPRRRRPLPAGRGRPGARDERVRPRPGEDRPPGARRQSPVSRWPKRVNSGGESYNNSEVIRAVVLSHVGPKGQVVLPKALRDAFQIRPGDRVVFDLEDGKIILTPVHARTAADLRGILRTPKEVDLHEGRRLYQEHLVEKQTAGRTDA